MHQDIVREAVEKQVGEIGIGREFKDDIRTTLAIIDRERIAVLNTDRRKSPGKGRDQGERGWVDRNARCRQRGIVVKFEGNRVGAVTDLDTVAVKDRWRQFEDQRFGDLNGKAAVELECDPWINAVIQDKGVFIAESNPAYQVRTVAYRSLSGSPPGVRL